MICPQIQVHVILQITWQVIQVEYDRNIILTRESDLIGIVVDLPNTLKAPSIVDIS